MKGTEALIPARFLTLLTHLEALIGLIWESKKTVQQCLPMGFSEHLFQTYHRLFLAGYASSFFLILVELMTFLSGLTLLSTNVAFISNVSHGAATVLLKYGTKNGWPCGFFWPVFFWFTLLPACVDLAVAAKALNAASLRRNQGRAD